MDVCTDSEHAFVFSELNKWMFGAAGTPAEQPCICGLFVIRDGSSEHHAVFAPAKPIQKTKGGH